MDETATNSKIKNIKDQKRDSNNFKKDYQPTANIGNDEQGDLVEDPHSLLASTKEQFFSVILCTLG